MPGCWAKGFSYFPEESFSAIVFHHWAWRMFCMCITLSLYTWLVLFFCCYCLLSYLIAVSSRLFLPYPFIFTFVSPILISIPEQEGVGEASEQCFVWENLFWGTELGSTPLKSWERQRNYASFDFSKWESLELMEVLCQQPPGSLWPLQMEWRCTIAFITNSRARPSWCIPAVKF